MRLLPSFLLGAHTIVASRLPPGNSSPAASLVCSDIFNSSIPTFFHGSTPYTIDITQPAPNSAENATCTVEPRTSSEVGTILKSVAIHRAPFAVKGAGHSANPGYSSTTGILISLRSFNTTSYSSSSNTVTLGAGLTWDAVYGILNPMNITVVGGRMPGVGVSGLLLGGGYSSLTSEYGLAIDNIVAMEIVEPDGEIVSVTQATEPDLFFALRGGWNNFGVVTSFTLKAYPQTFVMAGPVAFSDDHFNAFARAVENLSRNFPDVKAQMNALVSTANGTTTLHANLFYNAPTVPSGVFDELLSIPMTSNDFTQQRYVDFVKAIGFPDGLRATYNTVAVLNYSVPLLSQMRNQTRYWSAQGHSPLSISISAELFHPTLYTHSPYPSAYPHSPSHPLLPMALTFAWSSSTNDDFWYDAAKDAARVMYEQALAEGQDIDIAKGKQVRYGNYAIQETPIELVWGDNIPKLRDIRDKADPGKVMDLAGGWKLP